MIPKIVDFETFVVGNPWKNWVLLKLQSDDGLYGVGEASLNGFARSVVSAIQDLSRYFQGENISDATQIASRMLKGPYSDGGQIHRAAISAVNVAIWDALGKYLNQPIYNLWGGSVRREIPMYANGWYRHNRTPELFYESAQVAVGKGYQALKFDPFGSNQGFLSRQEEQLSLGIVEATRSAVGSQIDLIVEAHCRFDVPTALRLANRLEKFDILWFEEPVSFENSLALIDVAKRSPIAIGTGENFTDPEQFYTLAANTRNFIFQPDVMNIGGLQAAKRICEFASDCKIPVAPHDAQGSVSKASTAQLAATCSAIFIQEDFDEFNVEWTSRIVRGLEKVGKNLVIPSGPGLGIEVDWSEIRKHPYDVSGYLELFEDGWETRGSQASP